MPARNPIATIDMPGWVKGLNRDADPFQLELDESPDCLNVDFGLRGAVSKRKGFSRQDDSTPTLTLLCDTLISWAKQGGSTYRIAATDADGSLWVSTATTWTDSTDGVGAPTGISDYVVSAAAFNNKVYLTSLRSLGTVSFDGTTWVSMTASALDGTSSRFPRAAQILTMHDRMFAGNVISSGGTAYRSRLHWSNLLDAETWDAADYADFDPDDGSQIRAVAAFGESIVVFKDTSTHLLAGRSPDSFTRYTVDQTLGCVSPRTVVTIGAELLFFDRNNGVYGFNGAAFTQKDDKINTYLLDGMNYEESFRASAFVWRNRYFLSVPWGANAFNSRTFVYDMSTEAWTEYDFGVAQAALDGGNAYMVGPDDAVGAYKLFNTVADNGVAIDAYFFTPWLAPEGPEQKSRVRRLDTAWTAKGNINVDVAMYRDFNNAASYRAQTINTAAGGSVWDTSVWDADTWDGGADQVLSRTTGWGDRWRTVQFRIGVDGVADDFQLNRMALHISSLGRVRGEP